MTTVSQYKVTVGNIWTIENLPVDVTVDDFKKLEYAKDNPASKFSSYTSVCQNVLGLPGYEDLRGELQKAVTGFARNEYPDVPYEYPIVSSWTTLTKPGTPIQRHAHRMSLYSGVFYPYGQEEDMPLIMHLPFVHSIMTSVGQAICLPSKPGMVHIFPSSFQHHVDPVEGKKNRYSLAFNSFITATDNSSTASIKVFSGPV